VKSVTRLVIRYGRPYHVIFTENRAPPDSRSGPDTVSCTVPEPSSSPCRRGSATIANSSRAGACTSAARLTLRGPASTTVTVMITR
jgi:hypothetical protein